jgi:hypothetical protein
VPDKAPRTRRLSADLSPEAYAGLVAYAERTGAPMSALFEAAGLVLPRLAADPTLTLETLEAEVIRTARAIAADRRRRRPEKAKPKRKGGRGRDSG